MIHRTSDKHTSGAAAVLTIATVLAAVLPARPAEAGSHKLTEEDNRTVPVTTERALYIKNSRGKTIVVGKADAGEVSVRALKIVRAGSEDAARDWMDELGYQVHSDGKQISITAEHPKRIGLDSSIWALIRGIKYKAQIEFTIEVPSRFDVAIASSSGDVQVTSLDGSAQVYGSSGDVFLKGIGGNATVEVSSGDAEIVDVQGDIRLRSSSGDTVVRDAGGSINVEATSGDVQAYGVSGNAEIALASGDYLLERCTGDVVTRTASGDGVLKEVTGSVRAVAGSGNVDMDIKPEKTNEYVVHTSSGDVRVVFDPSTGYGFHLDVSTASGSIQGDLQLETVSRRLLRGVVGDGKGRLSIETSSGDVVVRQAMVTER
jgi:hypothetical protein